MEIVAEHVTSCPPSVPDRCVDVAGAAAFDRGGRRVRGSQRRKEVSGWQLKESRSSR
ncbi:hypothetical protein GWI33_000453, partial [Rhynchophorus ferrugineus]